MAIQSERRALLRLAVLVPGSALAAHFGLLPRFASAQGGGVEALLERAAYLLFPFPELGSEPYARVAASIAADESAAALIESGLAELTGGAAERWLKSEEAVQRADLERLEATPFFQYLLAMTRTQLFNDRAMWTYLGYGGSAMGFGGYVDRGLDDIDWLGDD